MACEYLNRFGTAQVLIENYYLKNYTSIFVKDQVKNSTTKTINNFISKISNIFLNQDNDNNSEHGTFA